MMTHFSQKVNVGIALVCMVNHSAIEQNEPNSINKHTDDRCPQTNNTKHIVCELNQILFHLLSFIIGGSYHMVKKYSRHHFRCLFLGLYHHTDTCWIFSWSIWCSIYIWWSYIYFESRRYVYAIQCKSTLDIILCSSISYWVCSRHHLAMYDCYHGSLGTKK